MKEPLREANCPSREWGRWTLLNQSSLLEGGVGAILVDGLEGLAACLYLHVAPEFRDPDPLGLQVWRHGALNRFRHVTTDTALFLGQSGTVDPTPHADAGTSNAADS